jgi:hypothetical protein
VKLPTRVYSPAKVKSSWNHTFSASTLNGFHFLLSQ